jgi:succinyl-CoA synthetase beta subunit
VNIHEYQAKALLESYKIPVPPHRVVDSVDAAERAYAELGLEKVVIKSQVHSGARGKAGGVKIVDSRESLVQEVRSMLGTRLVTHQTGPEGLPVNQLIIEAPSSIDRELYLGAVIDRAKKKIVFMASTEGGMDIEEVSANSPEKILTATVDCLVGPQAYQARDLAFKLNLSGRQINQFSNIMLSLAKMFKDCDLSLIEINPLVVTHSGDLICIDAKINIDDSALYRQPSLKELKDPLQEDERENIAAKWGLNYIALDGNIGCMVNGAGLAMATMDLIKLKGGDPANFLDVGGTATEERVTEAFKIILSDKNIKAVLVNIFGGIVRCDLIADGIIAAVKMSSITVPVVVRLEGNNADLAKSKLDNIGLNIVAASSFTKAAEQVVKLANEGVN